MSMQGGTINSALKPPSSREQLTARADRIKQLTASHWAKVKEEYEEFFNPLEVKSTSSGQIIQKRSGQRIQKRNCFRSAAVSIIVSGAQRSDNSETESNDRQGESVNKED